MVTGDEGHITNIAVHPDRRRAAIATRLKRAEGHLRRVIGMIEEGRPCVELATQLHAVERAVAEAKRASWSVESDIDSLPSIEMPLSSHSTMRFLSLRCPASAIA